MLEMPSNIMQHYNELDAFIQPADTDSTLQDHPDLTVNPVMTYKIKRAKDEARAMQRRLALIAEGKITADEAPKLLPKNSKL